MEPVGLIAGAGRFPVLFAEKARALGIPVVCVGLSHHAPDELRDLSTRFRWIGLGGLGRMISYFRGAGVHRLVMAGKLHKHRLLSPWLAFQLWPDWRTVRFWYDRARRDNADDTLLLAVIAEFERDGLTFASALDICPELLVKPGLLTRRAPTAAEEQDIAYGWDLAKAMGGLDVGQSVAVRNRSVLAVEAIEGTDQAIRRAGELSKRNGFVVVKVAKPKQDRRFDVPTIGRDTIETMHAAGGKVLAVEAGQTIFLDEAETLALADRYGIAVVSRRGEG